MPISTRPKLVSFKLCPFVQKSIIVFKIKSVAFDIEYIDLASPPDWFLLVSPHNKVPLLFAEGTTLFESNAINEYIDEVWPTKLLPMSSIERAKHRGWVEYADNCLWDIFHLTNDTNRADYETTVANLFNKLDLVESEIGTQNWFQSDLFGMVDASFAPLFYRLQILNRLTPGLINTERHPKIQRWQGNLLSQPAVTQSVTKDFETLYLELVGRRQGYLAEVIPSIYRRSTEKSVY
jgi:glutathione S-transferase